MTFVGATMVGAPAARTLAAYYCPDVISAPLGTGPMICQGLFGARPNPAAMAVTFDIQLRIANPNHIPIPLASVLAAATVFPAASNEKPGRDLLEPVLGGNARLHGHPRRPARARPRRATCVR